MKKLLHLFGRNKLLVLAGLLAVGGLCYAFGGIAQAAPASDYNLYCGFTALGRQGCHGYLTNTDFYTYPNNDTTTIAGNVLIYDTSDPTANAIGANVDSAASFESLYEADLANGSPTNYNYNSLGAAVTIEAMLGVSGSDVCSWYTPGATTCTWRAAIAYAQNPTHLASWEAAVNYYASQGWITWNQTMYLAVGEAHGGHICTNDSSACWTSNARNPPMEPSADAQDVAMVGEDASGAGIISIISFNNPDGSQFILNRFCGNFEGQIEGLATPPPPVTLTCGNSSTSPSLLQPNQSYQLTVNDNYSGGGKPSYTAFHLSITGTNESYTNNNAAPDTMSATSVSYTTNSLRGPPAGTYTVSWQLFDNATAEGPACTGSVQVMQMPYFSAYGADISAGGDFNACTSTGGLIGSWYDSQTAKAGASALFAAIALGKIVGFGTGQSLTGGNPTGSPDYLAFANGGISGSSPSATIGGSFGDNHCLFSPDAPNDTTASAATTQTVGSTAVNGAQSITGNLTLNGGTVSSGNNVGLYVTGNVYISSNIIYGTDANGAWSINTSGTSDVPSFTLVVTGGNIYIDPNVTELDGIYVAEASNGTGGTIYTCGQSNFTAVPASSLYDSCNKQLTVYGSFIADQVNLLRTYGTLSDATSTENPNTGSTKQCSNGAPSRVCASEVFNFSPELYLSTPAIAPPNNGATTYDSETSLPPIL